MNINQIADEISPEIQENNAATGWSNWRIAKIGDGNDNPYPDVMLTPRDVNYRSLDGSESGIAVLDKNCEIPLDQIEGYTGEEVWIGNIPNTKQVVIIKLYDEVGYGTGGPTPQDQKINAAGFPDQSRLVIGRLVESFDTGMSVYIDFGPYPVLYDTDTGAKAYVSSADADISDPTDSIAYNPTTVALAAGEHRLLGIALSRSTGRFYAIPGAIVSTANTLPSNASRSEFTTDDALAIDFGEDYACGFVYNYFGQTHPNEDDLRLPFDPRQFMNTPAGPVVEAGIKKAMSYTWFMAAG